MPSTALDVVTLPYERGLRNRALHGANVLRVQYSAESAVMTPDLPVTLTTIASLPAPIRTRMFMLSEQMTPSSSGHSGHGSSSTSSKPMFTINGQAYPSVPSITSKIGETEVWEVMNDATMDHPFHLHGFFFQVLSRGGVPEPVTAWKDTVNIKRDETVRLAVRFDGYTGQWLYHCHILEHAENGHDGRARHRQVSANDALHRSAKGHTRVHGLRHRKGVPDECRTTVPSCAPFLVADMPL